MRAKKQANQYDKIFKENIEAVIPSLMKNILAINAITSEEIPDDIQHTKERKPDFLKKIRDEKGNTFVLQIEFQLIDEPKMVYRMAEYNIMLARKYEIPVRQYVIFIGSGSPKMPTFLKNEQMQYTFPLVSFIEIDYHIFLQSTQPEEVILSILGRFNQEKRENVINQIINRVIETSHGDLSLNRYFNQLRILSQLRNLELEIEKNMESIAKYIDEERDVLYIRGKKKEQERFVQNLLSQTDFDLEKIAQIANVTLDFVKNIQEKLNSEK